MKANKRSIDGEVRRRSRRLVRLHRTRSSAAASAPLTAEQPDSFAPGDRATGTGSGAVSDPAPGASLSPCPVRTDLGKLAPGDSGEAALVRQHRLRISPVAPAADWLDCTRSPRP